jgi:hypothetical protein
MVRFRYHVVKGKVNVYFVFYWVLLTCHIWLLTTTCFLNQVDLVAEQLCVKIVIVAQVAIINFKPN